jgi:serine/threonine protein kinase
MPLQDSFKRKSVKTPATEQAQWRPNVLLAPPTIEELRHTLLTAQENLRQPSVLTWRRDSATPAYLLTVTRTSDAYDPTWILHVDEENERKLTVVWSYTTSDPELIQSLINEEVSQSGPAAVIPDSLRPRDEEIEQRQLLARVQSEQNFDTDNYEILSIIGRGGMGTIYKGRHREAGNTVAIKVLHAHLLADPISLQRFHQEAEAASALSHPNLIRVLDFGVSRTKQPFLVMDYLEGVELQTLLSHCDHLEIPAFVNVFTQICDALSYAHMKGLVHRDLKPGNIMLLKGDNGSDIVKIIDFGIAKAFGEHARMAPRITTTGELLGSPAYMSPEQCGGAVLDTRSDIYSLGCVMYEAATGLLPFNHESTIKTILMHVNEEAMSFAEARPDLPLPIELERIIFKALEKDPVNRYQSAAQLNSDLWEFAATGFASRCHDQRISTHVEMPIETTVAAEAHKVTMRTYNLLRLAGILTDEIIEVAHSCHRLVDEGRLTLEQAIRLTQLVSSGHSLNEAARIVQAEHSTSDNDKNSSVDKYRSL